MAHDIAAIDQKLMGGPGVRPDPGAAIALYQKAFEEGSGEAGMRLALMAAQGLGRAPDWSQALDLLLSAAELGHIGAQRQLAILSGARDGADEPWRGMRARIDIDALLAPPPVRPIRERPRIGVMEGFAPGPFAAWLIERAEPLLEPSLVYDGASGQARPDSRRTATTACFEFLQRDLVFAVLQERIARLTRLATPFHEPPNVLSYLPGQQFEPHFDFLEPSQGPELAALGQRVATAITYLNDDYEGGATAFVEAGLSFRGKPGDCLIFFNVAPDGAPDRTTRHAGLPPTSGRKWMLSQWLRDKVQPLM